MNALGCRTFCAASHSADHWDSISPFFRGRDAHLPSSSPARRARDRHEWGRLAPNGPPSGKGLRIAIKRQKKARSGVRKPQNWNLESVKISKRNDTAQLAHCKSCPSETSGSLPATLETETSPHLLNTCCAFPSVVGRGANHPASGSEPRKSVQRSDERSNKYAM